jgi:hypothetical protein
MDTVNHFDKYEIVGLHDPHPSFMQYLIRKYPNYGTEPYGSLLISQFILENISKQEYIELISSGRWVEEEMRLYGPGWVGAHWLIPNADTPLIAAEIKKAGGLLISFTRFTLYDDPMDYYKGVDVIISIEDAYNIDNDDNRDEENECLFNEINKCLQKK